MACSKLRKSPCIEKSECTWVVGKGCRAANAAGNAAGNAAVNKANKAKKPSKPKVGLTSPKGIDEARITFNDIGDSFHYSTTVKNVGKAVYRDIPLNLKKAPRFYYELFAKDIGLKYRGIKKDELLLAVLPYMPAIIREQTIL